MFRLSAEEAQSLRFHSGTLKRGQHDKYLPDVFTEQGVAMLSGILRSHRAVQVNVAIMRAFVRLREALSLHKELAYKLAELERKIENHDAGIHSLFEAIRQLMAPSATAQRPGEGNWLPHQRRRAALPGRQKALPTRLTRARELHFASLYNRQDIDDEVRLLWPPE